MILIRTNGDFMNMFKPFMVLMGISSIIPQMHGTTSLQALSKPAWLTALEAYDMDPIIARLTYNPRITVHSRPQGEVSPTSVTLYAHAWGDSQRSIDYFQRNATYLPDTVVGFDFIDANYTAFLPPYKKSNFCQSRDIASFALTLAVLDRCGVETINLFGHCRGAGSILTTLARLTRYPLYKRFFRKLGISRDEAKSILKKVEKGIIILNCPFIDIRTTIQDKPNWIGRLLCSFVLPLITQYKAAGDSPLKAAHHLKKLNLTIGIYTEQQDMIVGNHAEAALYAALWGPDTYFCIGDHGGHIHLSSKLDTLCKALSTRYEHHQEDETTRILEELQPFISEAAELSAYHDSIPVPYLHIHETVAETDWVKHLHSYPLTPLVKLFGYNPAIRVYASDTIVENHQEVTLYAHGYGEYQEVTVPFLQLNSHLMPGTIVSFNFPDVVAHHFMPNLRKSNVAQAGDIKAFALMLKLLDECGLERIHLFGTSRGGGTVMNTLGRLCTYEKHAEFFDDIEISQKQADRILAKISRSTIVLNCPFIDSRASAYYWFKEWSDCVLEKIVYKFVEHRLTEDQAIQSAELIRDKNFTILVHFEHNDTVVGNSKDAEFYTTLAGRNTYLLLGNDGGHLHNGKTLGSALQAFRHKHGGAYYNDPGILNYGTVLLAQEELIREDISQHITYTYEQWS